MFVEKLPISLHLGTFLPQHAMLARYLLLTCVRPSVCLSVTSPYSIDTTGRIELVFNMEAFLHLSYNVLKKIQVAPEIRVRSCELFPQTLDSENFATASRSYCQQNSSSTVEPVDDPYTTIDESWLFTACRSTATLKLHYFDLLWICCTNCSTVDKILTDVARRAVRRRTRIRVATISIAGTRITCVAFMELFRG